MAKPKKRKRARELRREGWSIQSIADELDVWKESVIDWCRDISLTDDQKQILIESNPHWHGQQKGADTNKQQALEKRQQYQKDGRQKAREGNPLHRKACMLYWAEGYKSRTQMTFTNTDVHMMQLFMRFLRDVMQVSEDDIYLRVYLHSTDDAQVARVSAYWRNQLNLPLDHQVKTHHKQGTNSRKTHYPNGICRIEVYSVALVQHIYGAIQEYAGFENPEWVQ